MSPKPQYFDLHLHTSRHSPCSVIPAERLIAVARSRGLDGIAITDHGYLWPREEIDKLKREAEAPDFTILAGAEISTYSDNEQSTGDVLIYGITELPELPISIDALCRWVHEREGVAIAPHPKAPCGVGDEMFSVRIDDIEIANSRYPAPPRDSFLREACERLATTGLASSDAHALEEVGRHCTRFDRPIRNERDLVEAILDGAYTPRAKPPPMRLFRKFGQA